MVHVNIIFGTLYIVLVSLNNWEVFVTRVVIGWLSFVIGVPKDYSECYACSR